MLALSTPARRSVRQWPVILVALFAFALLPGALGRLQTPTTGVRLPEPDKGAMRFEQNAGQTDPAVKYLAHSRSAVIFFTPSEVVLSLAASAPAFGQSEVTSAPSVLRLSFVGARNPVDLRPGEPLPGTANYFIGNDPADWHTGIRTYSGVTYGELYRGIDLQYEGTSSRLKGTYMVSPGADPAGIRWRYAGAQNLSLDDEGNLLITAEASPGEQATTVTELAPNAWQESSAGRSAVAVSYTVGMDGNIGFRLGNYDPAHTLMIDPDIAYSTYLGGSAEDAGLDVAADASGNAYVTGYTFSTDFPTLGAHQPLYAGSTDAFITKFNANGTVAYSSYHGGNGTDYGYSVAVDGAGNAYIAGRTSSSNFPVQNAYQPTSPGGIDAFISKLSADGATLLYSTYFGGSGNDSGWGVSVDGAGNAYLTGNTASTNFPVRNAYQSSNAGGWTDAFVTKLNTAASGDASLIYSTYLGGSGDDYGGGYSNTYIGHGIASDGAGGAYVTGETSSTDFPVRNAYQSTRHGDADAFLTKIDTTLAGTASLLYSTYLGGTGGQGDQGRDVAIDSSGNAYIAGATSSTDFPTRSAYGNCFSNRAPFVAKLNPASAGDASLIYSTCFGASGTGAAASIAVDGQRRAHVTGSTASAGFPQLHPVQSYGGGTDAFVLELIPSGAGLVYSTYLGGNDVDQGYGVAVSGDENTYVAGQTYSANFPTHNPAYPYHGAGDGFVTLIHDPLAPTPGPASSTPTRTPVNTSTPTATFTQVPGNHPPIIRVPLNEPYRVGVEVGNYLALRFDASDPDTGDTVRFSVTGLPSGASFPIPSAGNPIWSTFTWRPTSPDIGTYYMTVTATDSHGAQDSATVRIDVVAGCVPYFTDVFPAQYFYPAVQYLFCHLVVQGYVRADQTFVYRPYYNTTRGQFSKMVALSYNLPQWNPPTPDFEDVPSTDTFYRYIEAAFHAGIINGYPCGGPGEACVPPANKPYFRTYASITRGQLSKLVVGAAGWQINTSGGPHFSDVAPGSTFYGYIETAYQHGVISGYACGGAGEPCDPQNRAYFRPNNKAVRGQIAKILWLALGSPVP